MIELKNLERSYPIVSGRSWVLRNVNLVINEGEFLSITGPSGSGKSSLLNVLGMLDGEWQGEFFFEGKAVHAMALKQRQTLQRDVVGFIFQQYHLLSDLTVAENLELPLTYRDLPSLERTARVADALDRFQIVGKKDLLPTQLSGGQQQLVAVARALITKPRVILADEPTGALHSDQAKMIMQTLRQLHSDGATIVQVTHNPEYAAMGSRRVELFDGWLKEIPS